MSFFHILIFYHKSYCRCLPNVGGRKCDTCLPGYHSFPYCSACDCDPAGTEKDICNQVTSQCLCKVLIYFATSGLEDSCQ